MVKKKKSRIFGLFRNKENPKKEKKKLKGSSSVRTKSIRQGKKPKVFSQSFDKKISKKQKNKLKISSSPKKIKSFDKKKKSGIFSLFTKKENSKKQNKIIPKEEKNLEKPILNIKKESVDKEMQDVSRLIPKDTKKGSIDKKVQDVKKVIPKTGKESVDKKVQDVKKVIPKTKGANKEEHIKTYIPGFDDLIKEGIPRGSAVLVEGGPGSGKTIFCLSLVKTMCERGKKVLYMSFEETEEKLKKHMEIFGAKPAEYEKKGLLYVKRFNALDIARSIEALLSEAKKELLIDVQPILIPKDFEPDIVLIDSLTSIGSAFSGEENRFRIYMEQLFRYLESHDITSFLVRETSNPTHIGRTFVEKSEAVSFLSDGIIIVYNVVYEGGARKRALEFLKMRGAEIDRRIVELEIKVKKGIIVYPRRTLKGKYLLT